MVEKALQIWDLELVPIKAVNDTAPLAQKNPEEQFAYICNLHEHWCKFGGSKDRWYNLNSTLASAQHVTCTYLVFHI